MATEQTPPELASRDARRRRREFNSLVWLCGWGGVTAGAPLAFAIASQTDTASKRLRRVFAARESSAALRVTQLESDSQLLAAQVRALVAERDRLSGRIALLESSIDDMSGAIKKQAAATAAVLAAKENPPAPSPKIQAASASVIADKEATTSIPPNPLPKGDFAPSVVPMLPARIANASAVENDQPTQKQAEFGLDLGGGATIDGMRLPWITVKASFGPLLSGLRPLATRDHRTGANGYRLIVGPLPNSAATGLCAHFVAARTPRRAVRFDGEQIAQQ